MPQPKRQRRTVPEMHRILSELKESGLSRRQFAFSRDIPLSTLQNWVRKHRSVIDPELPSVIPLGTLPGPVAPIEIELPGGDLIRLGPGFCHEDLRAVLVELRRC